MTRAHKISGRKRPNRRAETHLAEQGREIGTGKAVRPFVARENHDFAANIEASWARMHDAALPEAPGVPGEASWASWAQLGRGLLLWDTGRDGQ